VKIEHFRQLHIGKFQDEYDRGRNFATTRLAMGEPAPDGGWPHHHWTVKVRCEDLINHRNYLEAARTLGYLDRLQPRYYPASTGVDSVAEQPFHVGNIRN